MLFLSVCVAEYRVPLEPVTSLDTTRRLLFGILKTLHKGALQNYSIRFWMDTRKHYFPVNKT